MPKVPVQASWRALCEDELVLLSHIMETMTKKVGENNSKRWWVEALGFFHYLARGPESITSFGSISGK